MLELYLFKCTLIRYMRIIYCCYYCYFDVKNLLNFFYKFVGFIMQKCLFLFNVCDDAVLIKQKGTSLIICILKYIF